jgi:hypothetical protein
MIQHTLLFETRGFFSFTSGLSVAAEHGPNQSVNQREAPMKQTSNLRV